MFDFVKTKFAFIAGGVAFVAITLLFAAILTISTLEEKVAARDKAVATAGKELILANARAAANAEAALSLKAEVDRLAAQASQAARLRRELSAFRTSLVEKIDNAPTDTTPVPAVIADTFGELHDRFQPEAGSDSAARAGADPR